MPFSNFTLVSHDPSPFGEPVQSIYIIPSSDVWNALQQWSIPSIVTHPALYPAFSALLCTVSAKSPHVYLSLIHISEPTRRTPISYAVFCLKNTPTTEIYTSLFVGSVRCV